MLLVQIAMILLVSTNATRLIQKPHNARNVQLKIRRIAQLEMMLAEIVLHQIKK